MHYCLNRRQLRYLLTSQSTGSSEEDEHCANMLSNAEDWQDEIGVHNYLACGLLSQALPDLQACNRIIADIYKLPERMAAYIQELEPDFIAYMLRTLRSGTQISLEDQLIELQVAWREYDYGQTLRY